MQARFACARLIGKQAREEMAKIVSIVRCAMSEIEREREREKKRLARHNSGVKLVSIFASPLSNNTRVSH